MRISDWSSDVCSSDLQQRREPDRDDQRDGKLSIDSAGRTGEKGHRHEHRHEDERNADDRAGNLPHRLHGRIVGRQMLLRHNPFDILDDDDRIVDRSEEHTSELQSLMRISYAVFCLKKKTKPKPKQTKL